MLDYIKASYISRSTHTLIHVLLLKGNYIIAIATISAITAMVQQHLYIDGCGTKLAPNKNAHTVMTSLVASHKTNNQNHLPVWLLKVQQHKVVMLYVVNVPA